MEDRLNHVNVLLCLDLDQSRPRDVPFLTIPVPYLTAPSITCYIFMMKIRMLHCSNTKERMSLPSPLFCKDDYCTTPSVGNKSENTNLTGLLFRKISN